MPAMGPVIPAAVDGFMMALGFGLVLLVLGAIREVLGYGTIFADMDLLFGPIAANWEIDLLHVESGLLIAVLPPGAFIVAGFLIALKNIIDGRIEKKRLATSESLVAGSKRVRTTGNIS